MKANYQGKGIFNPKIIMNPVCKLNGIFNDRSLPSTSWGQLKAIVIVCAFSDSWTTLAKNSKEGFLALYCGF